MVRRKPRSGLILLVVLGMLALLSLLSVTYLVFSAESRKASFQQARGDYRGTPPDKLIDQAVHQVMRGTTDSHSPFWLNDLFGDLHGESTLEPFQVFEARSTQTVTPPPAVYGTALPAQIARDNPVRVAVTGYVMPPALATYDSTSPESPRLYGGHLLKIPIAWPITTGPNSTVLPEQHDAWTGRTVTFMQGPLQGQSFRILRYMGEAEIIPQPNPQPPILDPIHGPNQYSIVIDLSEVRDRVTSRLYGTAMVTRSVNDWISISSARNCIDLLYGTVVSNGGSPATYTFTDPFNFFISAGVTNSNGLGVDSAGNIQYTPVGTTGNPSPFYDGVIPDAYMINRAKTVKWRAAQGLTYTPAGDTDEFYDAADFQNPFLAMRQPDAGSGDASDRITPSFHRQAVINFLMDASRIPDLASFTGTALNRRQFTEYLELIQRATLRPLSIRVRNFNGPGADFVINPSFTGSNLSDNRVGMGYRTPQLNVDWANISTPVEIEKFQAWLRWLTRGPWDVDNDSDLIADSIWVDPNFPLITSAEGKLLKVLMSFYIEDLDGKLDLNAAGSPEQSDDSGFNAGRANVAANSKYGYLRNVGGAGAVNTHWPQGLGYGTGDISLRPLFSPPTPPNPNPPMTPAVVSPSYGYYLNWRYGSGAYIGTTADTAPGVPSADDPISMMNDRYFFNTTLPQTPYRANNPGTVTTPPAFGHAANCFPFSVRGRAGIAVDLLGNPIMFEDSSSFNETVDDPYDTFAFKDRNSDRGITVSDWERLTRFNDVDRSGLPSVLQKISAATLATGAAGYLDRIRSISPRNVTLNLPRFAADYEYDRLCPNPPNPPTAQRLSRRVSSFIEMVEAFAQARFTSITTRPIFTTAQLRQLFPMEFRQNMPLNINRPLGNGIDDRIGTLPSPLHEINGVIDEADEIHYGQAARYQNNVLAVNEEYARTGASFDPELEADTVPLQTQFDGNQPKQFLARHLYCLAQLILPDTYVFANDTTPSQMAGMSPADRLARRARTLAQWAVNVIDFRDADSAMTRFAYDATPFDTAGWVPTDGVVFGVEAPELLITEGTALHDMRVRRKPGSTPPTREQLRIPEGSLFLEFYCPRTTMPAAARGTLDDTIPPAMAGLYEFDSPGPTGTLKLNLGAMTPVNPMNPVAFPVWRVAFTKPVSDGAGGFKDRLTQVHDVQADRFNYSYQFDGSTGPSPSQAAKVPWWLNTGAAPIAEPEIDRILWFSGVTPTAANAGWTDPAAADKIFYGYAGSNYLAGGQYLVVGPRDVTYFGSRNQGGSGPRDNQPSHQRIQINNSTTSDWVQYWDLNNDPLFWKTPAAPLVNGMPATVANWPVNTLVRNTVTLVAGMDKPASWTDPTHATYKIGLNISEPTRNDYYPEPDQFLNSSDTTVDPPTNAQGFASLPKDAYIDTDTNAGTSRAPLDRDSTPHAYLQNSGWRAGAEPDRPAIETQERWSAAVLQRLADPLRGWDAKYNPYITVDWLPIDLTVFSGEEQFTPDGTIKLGTRRKTGALVHPNTPTSGATMPGTTFYSYHNAGLAAGGTAVGSSSNPYFDYEMQMEYICKAPPTPANTRGTTAEFATLGYLNPQFTIRGTVGAWPSGSTDDYQFSDARYLGSPGPDPTTGRRSIMAPYFPNRDFVNVMELTSVPISSPGSFMQDFGYEPSFGPGLPLFTHTLDFEDLRTPAPTGPLATKRTTAMLLDVFGTKNPWPDAAKVESPLNLVVPGYVAGTATVEEHAKQSLFEPFRAPLNFLPTYREPGRINLNTLNETNVFRGLMWNAITPTQANSSDWYAALNEKLTSTTIPYWTEFQNLRRGFAVGSNAVIPDPNPYLDPAAPFEFAHPFMASTSYDKSTVPASQYDRASNAGLLRRGNTTTAPYNMSTFAAPQPRLFTADKANIYPDGGTAGNVPLNTFIRNYPASRLANLTTDRSSVFAIRVTLGYFEADAAGNLGIEYGSDEGKSKRHRAVYIIDRSIPVGYQPGQDINTENAILLRRIVE